MAGTIRDWEPDPMGLGPTQGPGSGKVQKKGGGGCVNRNFLKSWGCIWLPIIGYDIQSLGRSYIQSVVTVNGHVPSPLGFSKYASDKGVLIIKTNIENQPVTNW